ncbi:MAG: hypothetical protein FWD14_06355 [Treponema sp.]|nr:hypothetical protein [Treponema sp.]
MSFSPIQMAWYNGHLNTEQYYGAASLFNLHLYYNPVIPSDDINFFIGPFTTINYIYLEDRFYWDRFTFTIGLQTGIRLRTQSFDYSIVSLETGYRNVNGQSKYYFGLKLDLITAAAIFGTIIYLAVKAENRKENK